MPDLFEKLITDLVPYESSLCNLYVLDKKYTTVYLHFPSFYSVWKMIEEENQKIKFSSIFQNVKKQTYFIAENKLIRMNDKSTRVLILSLDEYDVPPKGLLDFVAAKIQLMEQRKCNCSIKILFQKGCQCGGK
jgi:hypothetical protein